VNKKYLFAFTTYVFSSTPHPLSRRTNKKHELLLSTHFFGKDGGTTTSGGGGGIEKKNVMWNVMFM